MEYQGSQLNFVCLFTQAVGPIGIAQFAKYPNNLLVYKWVILPGPASLVGRVFAY